DSQGEACPTDSGFIADQDRATIAKSSTLPHDSVPRVTSPAAEEGSMQQTLNELTAFCTSLQRPHLELLAKFQAQEVEINRLKERVKILEDKEGVIGDKSGDDAPIKGMSSYEGEAPAERISNDSEEIARVLTSMDAATVLAGEANVPTGSFFIPTAAPTATIVSTGSEVGPTASLIVQRRKGKEIMIELAFCDYHNMIPILEKYEHNQDFHPIVDFVEASHIRYPLTFNPTVYVSHIRQFWSTARIETTEEGTKILAIVDGKLRTVSESSIRRNLKLNDEAGINSLPDAKLFENLTLMGYNISPNQKFTFQKGQFSHQWKISSIPSCSGRTVPLFPSILVTMGEGSGTSTEPYHTPSPEAQQTSPTTHSSPSLPPIPTKPLPIVTPSDTPQLRQYTRRARIAQSSALLTAADEAASSLGGGSQGEACPTVIGLVAGQDRANITKTSTLPSDSTPRVTSLATDEGKMASKIEAQELEITNLKVRVKLLEDREGGGIAQSGDDAPIKGKSLDEREEAAKKGSDDSAEMVTVLTSLDAATVLSSRVAEVPTGSGSIPTVGPPTTGIPTGSGMVPTASPIFTTATKTTPFTRRKGKEKMVESDTPKKKKLQEQIDVQEVPEEKLKEMMELIPVEEVYVEALQVKHPIID
nr:hypothetical protein [Tanacetum cinerariifolium]